MKYEGYLICSKCGHKRQVNSSMERMVKNKKNGYNLCRNCMNLKIEPINEFKMDNCIVKKSNIPSRCDNFLNCINYEKCLSISSTYNWEGFNNI